MPAVFSPFCAVVMLAGVTAHVIMSKQALPPSRKIITLVDAPLRLTATPACDPSRHLAPSMSTQVQVMSGAVIAAPVGTKGGRESPPPAPPSPPVLVVELEQAKSERQAATSTAFEARSRFT